MSRLACFACMRGLHALHAYLVEAHLQHQEGLQQSKRGLVILWGRELHTAAPRVEHIALQVLVPSLRCLGRSADLPLGEWVGPLWRQDVHRCATLILALEQRPAHAVALYASACVLSGRAEGGKARHAAG